MRNKLVKLEQLARDWLKFSEPIQVCGLDCYEDYEKDLEVSCYFSDTGDHKSVRFKVDEDTIEIAFFHPVKFGGFTVRSIDKIDKAIIEYKNLLIKIKQEKEKEIEQKKQEQIMFLKERLKKLEEN